LNIFAIQLDELVARHDTGSVRWPATSTTAHRDDSTRVSLDQNRPYSKSLRLKRVRLHPTESETSGACQQHDPCGPQRQAQTKSRYELHAA